jgi:hypothetical protein
MSEEQEKKVSESRHNPSTEMNEGGRLCSFGESFFCIGHQGSTVSSMIQGAGHFSNENINLSPSLAVVLVFEFACWGWRGRGGNGGRGVELCPGILFLPRPPGILTDFNWTVASITSLNSDLRLAPRGHGAPRRWRVRCHYHGHGSQRVRHFRPSEVSCTHVTCRFYSLVPSLSYCPFILFTPFL